MKTCVEFDQLEFPVRLEQRAPDCFRLTYGNEVKDNLTYTQAAYALGISIMHALACSGQLDNRKKGER